MKNWDYYTVTLENKSSGAGVVGGAITYSPVICGDCLTELDTCAHGYDLRRNKPSKKGKV